MKKFYLYTAVCLLFAALFFGFISKNPATAFSDRNSFKRQLDLLSYVATLVQTSFVQEVDSERLFHGAMSGLLKTLDPYSQFLDAKAYEALKADTTGRFGGLGMEVSVKGGILHVIAPLADSPADIAGIKPGDVINQIDGINTKDFSLTDAVQKLRGEPGSLVKLTVIRDEEPKPLEFSIERKIIQAEGIREAKMMEPGVGYIRIAEFQEKTPADFKKELERLSSQGASGLILDLRNNPGGLLESAVKVTENFVPRNQLIVSTRGKSPSKNREYRSSTQFPLHFQKIAVIINRGSASGSEILSGALQDLELARIFGKKSYGKGCVQTLTVLPDGSAVRITTSFYYTPKGRLIHEIGISPDEEVFDDVKSGQDKTLEAALSWVKKQNETI